MHRVSVLSTSKTPNSWAFNYPLKVNLRRLLDRGIQLAFRTLESPQLLDCQTIFINSKIFSHLLGERENQIFEALAGFRERADIRLIWFDTSDSTFIYQGAVLPHVDYFYKAQLLVDRELYTKRHYGGRIYTDHVHRQLGAIDEHPYPAAPLPADQLHKLRVSWHSGLGDYGWRRFYKLTHLTGAVLDKLDRPYQYHANFCTNDARSNDISCRLGLGHPRETIRAHRRAVIDRVTQRGVSTDRLSPAKYMAEMRQSRIAISPFGLGEISLRDFEILLCGALLFKPSMDHLQTWPELYLDGQTYVAHQWDLSDFDAQLDRLLGNPAELERVRLGGLARYRHCLSDAGMEEFCDRIAMILEET